MFYSKSTGGFYAAEIHGAAMPDDVVEISVEAYQALLDGQSSGKTIQAQSDGHPALVDVSALPRSEALIVSEAASRLSATDWANQPDVCDAGASPRLLNSSDFIKYRAQVREIRINPALLTAEWPTEPAPVWGTAAVPALTTSQQIQQQCVTGAQQRLDDFAKTRNYDGILSACTYATSTIPRFAAEGRCAVDARDATWQALYSFMADVESGAKPMPTGFLDVEPLLPALAWPQ